MAISDTISINVTGAGEVSALADALDKAAQAAGRLDELAGKGISFSGAATGLGEMEKSLARIQAQADALNKSLADIGKTGAGADAGAAGLAKIADAEKAAGEQAAAMAAEVGKADDALKGQAGSADASAAGLGKLSDAQKGAAETAAGLRDAGAGVSDGLKVQASQTAALTALQADMADSQKALTVLSAEHAAVMADSNAKIATGQRLNKAAYQDASAEAQAAQKTQRAMAADAAAQAESTAKSHGMIGLAIGAAAVYGIDKAAQLQAAVTKLYTSAGESQKNLPAISQGILKLAPETATSQAQLAQGAYFAESAGFHGKDALSVLKAVSEGAYAEGAPLADVANAETSILNAYKIKPSQSMSVMNQMLTAVGQGKMTMGGLASALPAVLPTASAAGISLPQVLGSMSGMTAMGTSPDEAAQEIRHAITALQKPSNIQSAEMQMLGIDPVKLSKNLGKEGLTGTIEQVDTAIQKHVGHGGLVMIDTMNQSRLAVQSANEEIARMPASIQGTAKAFLDGSISVKAFNKEVRQGGESAKDANLLKQFESTAGTALGFSALVKSGLGNQQTVAAALNKLMGGQVGQQVALQLGGSHLPTTTSDVGKVGAAGQQNGPDVQGWADVQKTLKFQLGAAQQGLESALTQVGKVFLPFATTGLKDIAGVAKFFASNPGLTKDIAEVGGGLGALLGAKYVGGKVVSGAQDIGKMLGLGNIGKTAGLDSAAAGLSGAASALDGAAASLEGAAGVMKGENLPGGLPGEKPGGGPGVIPLPGEGGVPAGAGGVKGLFKDIPAVISAATGPTILGVAIGETARALGDKISPAGTTAGTLNKTLQQAAAQGPGPAQQLHPYTMGGFEGYLAEHFSGAVSNFLGFGSGAGVFRTIAQAGQRAQAAPVQDAGAGILGGVSRPAPIKIPPPDTSAVKAAGAQVQAALTAMEAVHPKPIKIPSPDISALKSAAGAAAAAGASAGAGFAAGIAGETGAVTAAASALAAAAAGAMRAGLKSASPSKVTEKIGSDFTAGFSQGIAGNTVSVKAASASIGSQSVASLLQGLAGGQSNISAAISAVMGAASNPSAVDTIRQTFATLIGDVPAKDTALVRYLNAQQSKLSALANRQGALMAQISNAQQIATSQIGSASITGAGAYVPALAASYGPLAAQSTLTGLGQMAADQKQYASVLAGLKKAGLNATSLSQFAQEGAAQGLPQALGLLQGGKGSVAQANAYEAQIIKASQGIGSIGGTAQYGAQQAAMSGLDAALKKQLTTLDTVMSKEAQAVIAHVEKALGTGKAPKASPAGSAAASAAASAAGGVTGPAATAAAGGLGKVGPAGSAAATGLSAVASAAGGAASALGKLGSQAVASAGPQPGRAQPLGGGGGGGGQAQPIHVHVHLDSQVIATSVQNVQIAQAAQNWQSSPVPMPAGRR